MPLPYFWRDPVLLGMALVWLSGFAAGLLCGWKLWRVTYIEARDRLRWWRI